MIVQLFENPAVQGRDWAADLEDERVWVRRAAAGHLSASPEEALRAVETLGGALEDRDTAVRKLAAQALALTGASAVGPLQAALRGKSPCARTYAAMLLGRLGPAAGSAVPVLREALRDPEPAVRWAVEQALESLEPGSGLTSRMASGSRSRRSP
jgi:HEAT repeat protein